MNTILLHHTCEPFSDDDSLWFMYEAYLLINMQKFTAYFHSYFPLNEAEVKAESEKEYLRERSAA